MQDSIKKYGTRRKHAKSPPQFTSRAAHQRALRKMAAAREEADTEDESDRDPSWLYDDSVRPASSTSGNSSSSAESGIRRSSSATSGTDLLAQARSLSPVSDTRTDDSGSRACSPVRRKRKLTRLRVFDSSDSDSDRSLLIPELPSTALLEQHVKFEKRHIENVEEQTKNMEEQPVENHMEEQPVENLEDEPRRSHTPRELRLYSVSSQSEVPLTPSSGAFQQLTPHSHPASIASATHSPPRVSIDLGGPEQNILLTVAELQFDLEPCEIPPTPAAAAAPREEDEANHVRRKEQQQQRRREEPAEAEVHDVVQAGVAVASDPPASTSLPVREVNDSLLRAVHLRPTAPCPSLAGKLSLETQHEMLLAFSVSPTPPSPARRTSTTAQDANAVASCSRQQSRVEAVTESAAAAAASVTGSCDADEDAVESLNRCESISLSLSSGSSSPMASPNPRLSPKRISIFDEPEPLETLSLDPRSPHEEEEAEGVEIKDIPPEPATDACACNLPPSAESAYPTARTTRSTLQQLSALAPQQRARSLDSSPADLRAPLPTRAAFKLEAAPAHSLRYPTVDGQSVHIRMEGEPERQTAAPAVKSAPLATKSARPHHTERSVRSCNEHPATAEHSTIFKLLFLFSSTLSTVKYTFTYTVVV